MRTTIDIHDDVLSAVKELARQQDRSLGSVVSQLLRQALTGRRNDDAVGTGDAAPSPGVCGFRSFSSRGVTVSNDMIDALRDAEGI